MDERWKTLNRLFIRDGPFVGPGFEPGPEIGEFLRDECRVLVVGAGGLGCELLKCLALSGFGHIDVIDMDTIDATNLNRQFLFRPSDVGRSKALVAAAKIAEHVPGIKVTPHHAMIQEKSMDFYADFHVIVLGLDSLEARRYMNSIACSFLEYDDNGEPDLSTVKPMVDGGTEGLKGHARVLIPGITPCFECTLWLFPPQVKFPLCTIAELPRSPAHCIEYAKLILWPRDHLNTEFDADDESHLRWVFEQAQTRATEFGITGVTLQLTQGVTKNIIPAIASTNAFVAAVCALETLKIVTLCSKGMDNYLMYVGTDGIYSLSSQYRQNSDCPVCSPALDLHVAPTDTLMQVIDAMRAHPSLGPLLSEPSVSAESVNLYMRGALEAELRDNLNQEIQVLVPGMSPYLTVNDRKLARPRKLRLKYSSSTASLMR